MPDHIYRYRTASLRVCSRYSVVCASRPLAEVSGINQECRAVPHPRPFTPVLGENEYKAPHARAKRSLDASRFLGSFLPGGALGSQGAVCRRGVGRGRFVAGERLGQVGKRVGLLFRLPW
jgi:hypothetical protein